MAPEAQLIAGDRNTDPFRADTVDLLRAEVAQLEQEVAERDARIAELTFQVAERGPRQDAEGSASDTLALTDRVQQLLDELARKDQREASLQEMLRAAEDANRAEREERNQI